MISLDRVSYWYPDADQPALRDVSFSIGAGELVLLAGPSGSGKSTVLRCLNGLVPHFAGGRLAGRIRVGGVDPVAAGPAAMSRLVGFVFQDPEAQMVVDRVEDEVAFALENAAVDPGEMRHRVEAALRAVGMWMLRERSVDALSGGEKQRTAIAAAIALGPRVLAVDEPTSQLDPEGAAQVLDALRRLRDELGLTVVLAEHRLDRVLPWCDRLIYLGAPDGRVRTGPPREMLADLDVGPPVTRLGRRLGWLPLPLSVEEAARHGGWPVAGAQWSGERVDHSPTASHQSLSARPQSPTTDHTAFPGDRGRSRRLTARPQSAPTTGNRPLIIGPPRLVVRDLRACYGDVAALRGVDLDVSAGEIVALVGRNGSGKTTLLRSVVGLIRPEGGRIEVDGASTLGRATADVCRTVGYLPQLSDDLLFAETVADELRVTLANHGLVDRPPIEPAGLLARLGLAALADRYPRDLSVGQRQRVAIGAITVTGPGLLLLDEPTRGMDDPLKAGLAGLLQGWCDEGTAVLLVTHDVELAAVLADRVVVLNAGCVVADGPPAAVLVGPLATQTARLFPGRGWLTPEAVPAGEAIG